MSLAVSVGFHCQGVGGCRRVKHVHPGSGRGGEFEQPTMAGDDDVGPRGGVLEGQDDPAAVAGQSRGIEKSRSRSRFGSHRRAGCSGAMAKSWVQAVKSPASRPGRTRPVLVEPLQRQVPQAGVLRDPDPVLAPGPAPVPQLEIGHCPRGTFVANAVSRYPSTSANRAPVGRSRPRCRLGHLEVTAGAQDVGQVEHPGSHLGVDRHARRHGEHSS